MCLCDVIHFMSCLSRVIIYQHWGPKTWDRGIERGREGERGRGWKKETIMNILQEGYPLFWKLRIIRGKGSLQYLLQLGWVILDLEKSKEGTVGPSHKDFQPLTVVVLRCLCPSACPPCPLPEGGNPSGRETQCHWVGCWLLHGTVCLSMYV